MAKFADLHVHTYFSDSTLSPEEVVENALKKELSAIAISDHDSVDGIDPAMAAANGRGLEIISSVELTVEREDAEIHMLGYFIDYKDQRFADKLREIRQFRVERMRRMVEKLKNEGVDIPIERVFEIAGRGSVGRPHLAGAMAEIGAVRNLREAFDRYIGYGGTCYVEKKKITSKEAVEMIVDSGGVPVLAHPKLMGNDACIKGLIEDGIAALEVYHPDHKPSDIKRYERIAKENGLLVTGGSDCHGLSKPRILMGSVRVPYDIVEKLKEKARLIRRR